MNRRGFFLTLAGAAAAGTAVVATTGEAAALPAAPLPAQVPGLDLEKAWHYGRPHYGRRCRRVWNGYRWVVRCW